MSVSARPALARWLPARETLAWGALVVNAEVVVVLAYLLSGRPPVPLRLLVVPFVWLNVAAWAVLRTTPVATGRRSRLLAAGVGAGYFLVLGYVGGVVGPAAFPGVSVDGALAALPPGWNPALFYDGVFVHLTLQPYKVAGYLALAYLVYATATEASNALVGGVLGLFSCVSCTFPIVASLVTGVAGSGTMLATTVNGYSYTLSTVVFVVTVGLLVWRPLPGRVGPG